MAKLLLKNATVYTGYADKVLKNTDILIEGKKIVKVANNINEPKAKTIDCTNKYITPGLINIHAHLFGTGKPSKNLGSGKSQNFIIAFSKTFIGRLYVKHLVKSNAKMELMGGVTTLRTSGDLNYSDLWLRNKHYRNVPRLLVPGYAITCNSGHGHGTFAVTSDDPEKLRALVKKNVALGVDYIKTCTTGGVMDATKKGDPGEVKITEEQLKAIVDEAHKHGLYVASHTESEEGVNLDVKCGVDFIEHGSTFSDQIAKTMKEKKMKFTITISPAVPFVELPNEMTKCGPLAQYNSAVVTNKMIKCAKKARKFNIPIGLGTDAACPFAFQHLAYREMAFATKMYDVTPLEALELMTINNAKLIGVSQETGSIEVNKDADLLLLSNDPMKNLDNFYDLDLIIHLGECFKQKKYPKFKPFEKIMVNFKCLEEYPLVD